MKTSYFLLIIPLVCFIYEGISRAAKKGEKPENLERFYYPVNELDSSRVYHYKADNAEMPDLYRVLTAVQEQKKRFFTTDAYMREQNGRFFRVELIKEELTDSGSFVREYIEMQYDRKGSCVQVPAIIRNSCVFKWKPKTGVAFSWSFRTEQVLNPFFATEIERRRTYDGKHISVKFHEKKYDAVQFSDRFEVTSIEKKAGTEQKMDFSEVSTYAKGIGLYSYERTLDGTTSTYTLAEIIPRAAWEKLRNTSLH